MADPLEATHVQSINSNNHVENPSWINGQEMLPVDRHIDAVKYNVMESNRKNIGCKGSRTDHQEDHVIELTDENDEDRDSRSNDSVGSSVVSVRSEDLEQCDFASASLASTSKNLSICTSTCQGSAVPPQSSLQTLMSGTSPVTAKTIVIEPNTENPPNLHQLEPPQPSRRAHVQIHKKPQYRKSRSRATSAVRFGTIKLKDQRTCSSKSSETAGLLHVPGMKRKSDLVYESNLEKRAKLGAKVASSGNNSMRNKLSKSSAFLTSDMAKKYPVLCASVSKPDEPRISKVTAAVNSRSSTLCISSTRNSGKTAGKPETFCHILPVTVDCKNGRTIIKKQSPPRAKSPAKSKCAIICHKCNARFATFADFKPHKCHSNSVVKSVSESSKNQAYYFDALTQIVERHAPNRHANSRDAYEMQVANEKDTFCLANTAQTDNRPVCVIDSFGSIADPVHKLLDATARHRERALDSNDRGHIAGKRSEHTSKVTPTEHERPSESLPDKQHPEHHFHPVPVDDDGKSQLQVPAKENPLQNRDNADDKEISFGGHETSSPGVIKPFLIDILKKHAPIAMTHLAKTNAIPVSVPEEDTTPEVAEFLKSFNEAQSTIERIASFRQNPLELQHSVDQLNASDETHAGTSGCEKVIVIAPETPNVDVAEDLVNTAMSPETSSSQNAPDSTSHSHRPASLTRDNAREPGICNSSTTHVTVEQYVKGDYYTEIPRPDSVLCDGRNGKSEFGVIVANQQMGNKKMLTSFSPETTMTSSRPIVLAQLEKHHYSSMPCKECGSCTNHQHVSSCSHFSKPPVGHSPRFSMAKAPDDLRDRSVTPTSNSVPPEITSVNGLMCDVCYAAFADRKHLIIHNMQFLTGNCMDFQSNLCHVPLVKLSLEMDQTYIVDDRENVKNACGLTVIPFEKQRLQKSKVCEWTDVYVGGVGTGKRYTRGQGAAQTGYSAMYLENFLYKCERMNARCVENARYVTRCGRCKKTSKAPESYWKHLDHCIAKSRKVCRPNKRKGIVHE